MKRFARTENWTAWPGRFDRWMPRRGRSSPSWSNATTGCTAVAGAWATTRRPGCAPAGARSRRTAFEPIVRTPRWSSTNMAPLRAGASTAAPRSCHSSRTSAATQTEPPPLPRWRITCIFVDKRHRGQGIARTALEGALDQIACAGGGLVEAISEVTTGRQAPGRFLFSATVELFEQYAFTPIRQVGKHAWILNRTVDPR